MADAKYQMDDGSYPINNCEDVTNAANLAHHSKTYSFAEVKAHVLKASEGLSCPASALPDTWSAASRPLPKENLVRGLWPVELRAGNADALPTLTGHFAVFNEWTEIDSAWEGRFMERIAPGAFAKTFAENRKSMRVLFQHGKDPMVGDKPLGPIDVLEEDATGARYEVPLLDTSYNRDLLPGLREGLYGASFRFRVVKEDMDTRPQRSELNPEGIPQRTIKEAQVPEFGPVTFPAYSGATAGVRSLTDEFILAQLLGMDADRLRQLLREMGQPIPTEPPAPALDSGAAATHSNGSRQSSAPWTHHGRSSKISHCRAAIPWGSRISSRRCGASADSAGASLLHGVCRQ